MNLFQSVSQAFLRPLTTPTSPPPATTPCRGCLMDSWIQILYTLHFSVLASSSDHPPPTPPPLRPGPLLILVPYSASAWGSCPSLDHHRNYHFWSWCGILFSFFFFFNFIPAPVAFVSLWAWGQIGAVAANLRHSHSHTGLELHLRPKSQP